MVPKKYATNYCPIGMQRILAILIENTDVFSINLAKVIKFKTSFEKRKTFDDHIHGFRANQSCESRVAHITKRGRESMKKNPTSLMSLECLAAFNLLSPKFMNLMLKAIK